MLFNFLPDHPISIELPPFGRNFAVGDAALREILQVALRLKNDGLDGHLGRVADRKRTFVSHGYQAGILRSVPASLTVIHLVGLPALGALVRVAVAAPAAFDSALIVISKRVSPWVKVP